MKISELFDTDLGISDLEIQGLALDSRQVQPHYAFFACMGMRWKNEQFIPDAIKRGAAIIFSDQPLAYPVNVPVCVIPDLKYKISDYAARFYLHPAKDLQIAGVTGTNGKTSCTFFIGAALQVLNSSCGIIGTLGIGPYGNLKLARDNLTTPDPITLQYTFSEFRKAHIPYVAMEVSSHGLDQGRVNHVPFSVGIFTNLTRDHLDYHGSMQHYANAKKKLFFNPFLKNAVVNLDDALGYELAHSLKCPVYAYTVQNHIPKFAKHLPIIKASAIKSSDEGIETLISSPWGEGLLKTGLLGEFNLSNLLAVLTTLCLWEVPFGVALQVLSLVPPVPGRMQMFRSNNAPLVVVDYSHTPDSLEKALKTLRAHTKDQLYCIFGCGGDRDKGKRPLMANIAEQFADHVVVTDDNPRNEDHEMIAKDIFTGFKHPEKITLELNRSKAIYNIIQYAKLTDCILIAGKGAETYQWVGNEKIPFSDIDEVRKALERR